MPIVDSDCRHTDVPALAIGVCEGKWEGQQQVLLFGLEISALAITSSFWQWVDHRQVREAGEIPVGGPEHTYPVKKAQCGHPGIVHDCTLQHGWQGDPLERIQVALTFS